MRPFGWEGAVGPRSMGNAVLREEAELPIQPCFSPPLPAETVTLAGPHQMVPNLLLDPVSNVREAPARMADRKVLHPATQNRVDLRNHLAEGPGPMVSENRLERAQQRRPLFHPRGAKRHPSVSPTANPTEVKAEKSEALALREVHPPSLLLVHLDLERRQFLSKSPFDRRTKPALARMSVHQDHQVSRPGEFHPQALAEPYLNVFAHTAPSIRPPGRRPSRYQWANSLGSLPATPTSQCAARRWCRRSRLYFRMAQRTRRSLR